LSPSMLELGAVEAGVHGGTMQEEEDRDTVSDQTKAGEQGASGKKGRPVSAVRSTGGRSGEEAKRKEEDPGAWIWAEDGEKCAMWS